MDISLELAKLAKQKGFKPTTIKFYSDKKNGSRNSEEAQSFNEIAPDDWYGEMYSCVDTEVLKKWFKIKGDSEEELMLALEMIEVAPEVVVASEEMKPEIIAEEDSKL